VIRRRPIGPWAIGRRHRRQKDKKSVRLDSDISTQFKRPGPLVLGRHYPVSAFVPKARFSAGLNSKAYVGHKDTLKLAVLNLSRLISGQLFVNEFSEQCLCCTLLPY